MKFKPELKTYSEVKEIFDNEHLSAIAHIATDDEVADVYVYTHRWELFDYALDDELIFDYHHVEDIQDYAYRYLQQKLNEEHNE